MSKEKRAIPAQLERIIEMKEIIYSIPDFIELNKFFSQAIEFAIMDLSDTATENDWFDDITVKRNIKELKEYQKLFEQVSQESMRQLGHIISLYEDARNILERYYDFSKSPKGQNDDSFEQDPPPSPSQKTEQKRKNLFKKTKGGIVRS